MIAVQLVGGLGNQLFQYSAARCASIKNGVGTILDVRTYPFDIYGRRFALGQFQLNAALRGDPNAAPALLEFPHTRSIVWRAQMKIAPWLRGPVVRQHGFAFDDSLERARDGCLLLGLFQSERFFIDVAHQIRAELAWETVPPPSDENLLAQIQDSNSVCVHFRMRHNEANGARTNRLVGATPPEYYERALEYLRARVSNPKLFVFADDPVWARQNVAFDLPTVFVSHNGQHDACRDLRLMAGCRHFVIPNSTLSWWGAWLSLSPDKIVVAPGRWFAGLKHDTRDVLPSSWIRM